MDNRWEALRTFEQSCKSAADASQKQLLSILKDNADTEYGKKYHFSDISSVSEYKKQVPFSTFEDYEDFVSKMMQGKEKLLTAYPVSFYAHTSGTLGAAKHIPYTEKAEEIVHRYASIAREAYEETLSGKLPHMPSEPKMLYLATAREDHAKDGTLITNFSGKILLEYRETLMRTAVQPELIFCDVEMDLMYLFAFYALREKNLICIITPFMAAVSDFFCYIEKHWEDLCRDIEEGVLRPSARTSSRSRWKGRMPGNGFSSSITAVAPPAVPPPSTSWEISTERLSPAIPPRKRSSGWTGVRTITPPSPFPTLPTAGTWSWPG